MRSHFIIITLFILIKTQFALSNLHVSFDKNLDDFLQSYCIKCHGPEKSKGDRVFHNLSTISEQGPFIDLSNHDNIIMLKDILDQLNLGEMPPNKKGVDQPSSKQLKIVRNWLTEKLSIAEQSNSKTETPLKRLTKDEYRRTLESLLGLKHLSYDPARHIPDDEQHHGFKNLANHLSLSDTHLNDWLDAADTYLNMALHFGPIPKMETKVITPEMWGYPKRESRTPWMYRISSKNHVDIGAGEKQLSDHIGLPSVPNVLKRGVRHSGYYEINIKAEAIRRLTHPYEPSMIPANLNQPMQLSLYIATQKEGLAAGGRLHRKKIAVWDLADHQSKDFSTRVWLNQGAIPFLNWDNGPGPSDWWMRDICKKYHTDIEFKGKEGSHAWHIIGKNLVPDRVVSDVWKGPLMRIHHFSLKGPLALSFSSKAQKKYFEHQHHSNKINLKKSITLFIQDAFRRKVHPQEVEPYLELALKAYESNKLPKHEAAKLAFKAILVAPDFLYHHKVVLKDGLLDPMSIANRLSYTLWSCPPDSILFKKTLHSNFRDPKVLRSEISRMLNDPKSEAFIQNFTTTWLRLDKLGIMPPSSSKYLNYYNEGLEELMKQETLLFTQHILQQNLPITTFIDSDFSFINQSLAAHYEIKPITGSSFKKVHFTDKQIRGGLLGQASILTLTANGVETSPVTRGIWILESILGTPPPPPPPDVEPLDPDIRGAKTLKERLNKHRKVESCADCHAKIDPYGFAMENFSPIGEFRAFYPQSIRWNQQKKQRYIRGGYKIDATSILPDGTEINDISKLKSILLKKRAQFSKSLTEKLLTYATGRELNFRDQDEIERIAFMKDAQHYSFRDLITEALSSQLITRP